MNYILFDGTVRNALLPFTFTRPVADIRIGILTIREKWEMLLAKTNDTCAVNASLIGSPSTRFQISSDGAVNIKNEI